MRGIVCWKAFLPWSVVWRTPNSLQHSHIHPLPEAGTFLSLSGEGETTSVSGAVVGRVREVGHHRGVGIVEGQPGLLAIHHIVLNFAYQIVVIPLTQSTTLATRFKRFGSEPFVIILQS